jgi:hypothetical protein
MNCRTLVVALVLSLPSFAQTGEPSDAGTGEWNPPEDSRKPQSNVDLDSLVDRWRHRAAAADDLPPKLAGFLLGVRLGLAIPLGKMASGNTWPISHWVPLNVPIQLDFGGRLGSGLGIGGYFQFAPHATANCPSGNCYALSFRVGLQAEFRFLNEEGPMMPWVGAALGWEWLKAWEEAHLFGGEYLLSGPELVLQGGVDFRLGRRWALGPYLAVHVSQYYWSGSTLSSSGPLPSSDFTTHAWIILGVRSSVTF